MTGVGFAIMNNNYNLMFDTQLKKNINKNINSKLLLHACCAPCSSYVLEYLSNYFDITLYFYNPNITDEMEYNKRYNELKRFIEVSDFCEKVHCIDGGFDANAFFEISKGKEDLPERSIRCKECYYLRMKNTAKFSQENKFDYFTTTLSISPHKNSIWINEIGEELATEYGVEFLYSDFKKKNGYIRSIELSKAYNLYRQDYCGCIYSRNIKKLEKST